VRGILPTVLDTRFEAILSQERSLAKAVAATMVEMNPLTVWDLMMLPVFFINFLKFRRAREAFTLNFLFTKKLALEAAFDMIDKGKTKEEVLARIENKTGDILDSDTKGIYSENIRRRQMEEINLLIEHYCKLLQAEGRDYASLVKNAYQTEENYTAFLQRLKLVEKEVNRAAKQTVRTKTASAMVSKMEKTTEWMRMAEAEKIFGSIK